MGPNEQQYVSRDLTHFVGRSSATDEERHELLLKILAEGELKNPAEPLGPSNFIAVGLAAGLGGKFALRKDGKISDPEPYFTKSVCFCDIPTLQLGVHVAKYGRFGISFLKPFLIAHGARPMMYVPKGARPAPFSRPSVETLADLFDVMVPEIMEGYRGSISRRLRYEPELANMKAGAPTPRQQGFMKFVEQYSFLLTQILAFIKFFDETTVDHDPSNFYMEREWRVLTNIKFTQGDVSQVFVAPGDFEARLKHELPKYAARIHVLA